MPTATLCCAQARCSCQAEGWDKDVKRGVAGQRAHVAGIRQPLWLVWRAVRLKMTGCETTVMASSTVKTMKNGTASVARPPGGTGEAALHPGALLQGQSAGRGGRIGTVTALLGSPGGRVSARRASPYAAAAPSTRATTSRTSLAIAATQSCQPRELHGLGSSSYGGGGRGGKRRLLSRVPIEQRWAAGAGAGQCPSDWMWLRDEMMGGGGSRGFFVCANAECCARLADSGRPLDLLRFFGRSEISHPPPQPQLRLSVWMDGALHRRGCNLRAQEQHPANA